MNGDESECSVKQFENREITEEWQESFSTGNNTQHQLQLILAMIGSPPDEFVRASSPRPSSMLNSVCRPTLIGVSTASCCLIWSMLPVFFLPSSFIADTDTADLAIVEMCDMATPW